VRFPLQHMASNVVHLTMYGFLIAMPATGIAMG
jgi:cytochrome b561